MTQFLKRTGFVPMGEARVPAMKLVDVPFLTFDGPGYTLQRRGQFFDVSATGADRLFMYGRSWASAVWSAYKDFTISTQTLGLPWNYGQSLASVTPSYDPGVE